jgi:uncharacterized surface protein with fasciclin (FAS1) repeats
MDNLNAAGLAKTFEDSKDITIFAPTNAAFNAASSVISSPPSRNMSATLTSHILHSVQYSNALKDGQTLSTAEGRTLKVKISNGTVYINEAKVVTTDILIKNGVVHIIDGIL